MKPGLKIHWRAFRISGFMLVCLMLLIVPVHAISNYEFNERCIKAYQEIIALNFQKGKAILDQEKKLNPDNLIPVFLENYIDFLTMAIGEEQSDFLALKPNRSNRINALSAGNATNPWHRHCLAAVYLQWSFSRVKFGEYPMAGLDLNRAYRLLEENKSQHPGFVPDLLLSGVLNALIGSIPENYRWVTRLVGMDGAIEQGRSDLYEIIALAETNPGWVHLKSEAYFYLAFIEMNLQSDKSHVVQLLERMNSDQNKAYGSLNCYIRANLSIRTGKNDEGIEILENCNIPEGSYPFHYMEFVLGNARLHKLDLTASRHFLSFVNRYDGSNYIKSAYQRLAWISLLNGDQNGYRFYISRIPTHGSTFVDEDKQAEREATSKQLPNTRLLQARLLFDGGYYETAFKTLDEGLKTSDLPLLKDSVEYLYRKARIFHELGNTDQAKEYYRQTIEKGSGLPYFFAGNAALQTAMIYENEGNYDQALYYYDLCLKMRFTEYRSSIHQKARAGRQRVTAKK